MSDHSRRFSEETRTVISGYIWPEEDDLNPGAPDDDLLDAISSVLANAMDRLNNVVHIPERDNGRRISSSDKRRFRPSGGTRLVEARGAAERVLDAAVLGYEISFRNGDESPVGKEPSIVDQTRKIISDLLAKAREWSRARDERVRRAHEYQMANLREAGLSRAAIATFAKYTGNAGKL